MLDPLSSYFFGDQIFRFDMWKKIERLQTTFIIFTIMFFHYNLSIHEWYCCVFFFYVTNMFGLNLYNLKKIDTTFQNVDSVLNLEQIPRSSKKALGI